MGSDSRVVKWPALEERTRQLSRDTPQRMKQWRTIESDNVAAKMRNEYIVEELISIVERSLSLVCSRRVYQFGKHHKATKGTEKNRRWKLEDHAASAIFHLPSFVVSLCPSWLCMSSWLLLLSGRRCELGSSIVSDARQNFIRNAERNLLAPRFVGVRLIALE